MTTKQEVEKARRELEEHIGDYKVAIGREKLGKVVSFVGLAYLASIGVRAILGEDISSTLNEAENPRNFVDILNCINTYFGVVGSLFGLSNWFGGIVLKRNCRDNIRDAEKILANLERDYNYSRGYD